MIVAEGRRKRGRRRTTAITLVGALMGLQALAAVPASAAATSCDFTGSTLTVGVDGTTANVFSQDVAGNILLDTALSTAWVGGSDCATSPVANVANVTAINISGPPGVSPTDETVTIDMVLAGETVSWGAINWTLSLGDNTAAGDTFIVTNAGSADPLTTDWGASGVDLNGDGDLDVVLAGIENSIHLAGAGDADSNGDTVNAGGSAATGAAYPTAITITGGAGDDTLTGGAVGDDIDGGGGDDTIAGGLGNDTLEGGAGEDTIDYSASANAVNVNLATGVASGEGLDMLTGFENIIGSAFNDTLTGDGGDNTISPGLGDDTVNGGAGSDTVDYSDAPAAVTVDLGADAPQVTGGSGSDTLTSIENATGSAFNDSLTGNSSNNELRGGAGNDILAGMAGTNLLIGGAGIDTVDYSWSSDPVVPVVLELNCLGADGSATGPATDTIRTMENAILTSGDDSFIGNEFANRVWPNGGQNSLNGDGTCAGSPAGGGDTLDYGMGYESGVEVNLAGGATANDSAIGFENVFGSPFGDTIVGNELSNLLVGRGGPDTIRGGGGDDTLRGGPGNDTLRGGAGDDVIRGGAGNDRLLGGAGDDSLFGMRGNDILRGGAGDDDLFGGPGNDRLFGGPGDDFGNGGAGRDLCRSIEVMRNCTRF